MEERPLDDDAGFPPVDALIRRAEQLTGLEVWSNEPPVEGFTRLVSSLREASLTPTGVKRCQDMLVRALVNRVRIREALRTNPPPADADLREVVIIAGLPRTGATHLLELMAQDSTNRVLRLFELLNPAGLVDDDQRDLRLSDAKEWIREYYRLAPGMESAHQMTADGPNECHHLFANTFESPIFSFRADVPAYSEWLAERDPSHAYREYQSMLGLLRGPSASGQRLVLKDCFHPWRLRALVDAFPRAKFIQMHRDPLEVLPAWCSMSCMVRSMASDAVQPKQVGEHWSREMIRATDNIVSVRQDHAIDKRFFDIRLVDFRVDPIGEIARFYEWAGYDASHLRTTIIDQRAPGRSRHAYSMEMFSLDLTVHQRAFSAYKERFRC